MEAAQRCVETLDRYGVEYEFLPAVVPSDAIVADAMNDPVFMKGFETNLKWSRIPQAVSAHLSHRRIWNDVAQSSSPVLILEHDAILTGPIPDVEWGPVTNVGKPSYGKFRTSKRKGVQPLFSKRYFPGAHGYVVTPEGGIRLSNDRVGGSPDTYLHISRFPWLAEYTPWFVDVIDTFSSIQMESGTMAKHNITKGYRLL